MRFKGRKHEEGTSQPQRLIQGKGRPERLRGRRALQHRHRSYRAHALHLHTDAQGNVVALTDENGDIVEKFTYDVYGRLTAAWAWNGSTMVQVLDGDTDGDGDVDGDDDPAYLNDFIDAVELFAVSIIDNALLFQSRRLDEESGLYYFRNRQYDPEHGRFLSRDSLGYQDSYCLYQFVNNNPMSYLDPTGTMHEGCTNCTSNHMQVSGIMYEDWCPIENISCWSAAWPDQCHLGICDGAEDCVPKGRKCICDHIQL